MFPVVFEKKKAIHTQYCHCTGQKLTIHYQLLHTETRDNVLFVKFNRCEQIKQLLYSSITTINSVDKY